MKGSISLAVLATLSSAIAGPVKHAKFHAHKHARYPFISANTTAPYPVGTGYSYSSTYASPSAESSVSSAAVPSTTPVYGSSSIIGTSGPTTTVCVESTETTTDTITQTVTYTGADSVVYTTTSLSYELVEVIVQYVTVYVTDFVTVSGLTQPATPNAAYTGSEGYGAPAAPSGAAGVVPSTPAGQSGNSNTNSGAGNGGDSTTDSGNGSGSDSGKAYGSGDESSDDDCTTTSAYGASATSSAGGQYSSSAVIPSSSATYPYSNSTAVNSTSTYVPAVQPAAYTTTTTKYILTTSSTVQSVGTPSQYSSKTTLTTTTSSKLSTKTTTQTTTSTTTTTTTTTQKPVTTTTTISVKPTTYTTTKPITTTTTAGNAPPAPTGPNTVSGCTEWYVAVIGDYCALIASNYGLDTTQFINWNPSVGTDCHSLLAGDAYCVSTSKNPTTTTTTTPVSAPTSGPPPSGDYNYKMYTGDGTTSQGWPYQSQWLTFEQLWNFNLPNIQGSCKQYNVALNSDSEIASLKNAIQTVGSSSGVDSRFILAIVMQESNGCVRVPTTSWGHANPGLMQTNQGTGSCNINGNIQNPCPDSEILQMITDGTTGTTAGDGLKQCMAQSSASDVSEYYKAARIYNGGLTAWLGAKTNLGAGCCTLCYSSDIANRLTGWHSGVSTCTLGLGSGA